ncbi:MAG: glycosyltransferase family 61 protein, partial [Candidatus Nanopelagicales bacterium]
MASNPSPRNQRRLPLKSTLRRLRSRLARRIVRAVGVDLADVLHLDSHERPPASWVERIGVYAEPVAVTCVHPRDRETHTHGFGRRWIYRIPECIWDPQANQLYSTHGSLIAESTSWPPLNALTSWPLRPGRGQSLDLDTPCVVMPASGYYHWLIEDLPCVLAALAQEPRAAIVVSGHPPAYVSSFLNGLSRRVVQVDGPVSLHNVVLVGRGPDTGWAHPADTEHVRSLEPATVAAGSTSLYVSRQGSRRSPTNEAAVQSLCSDYGLAVIHPSSMTVTDQARLFANATLIVGPHGAGLANSVWAPAQAVLIELMQADYVV